MLSFWDFWGDGGKDCILTGGGQAHTLSYIANAVLLGHSEENAFLFGIFGGMGGGIADLRVAVKRKR